LNRGYTVSGGGEGEEINLHRSLARVGGRWRGAITVIADAKATGVNTQQVSGFENVCTHV